MKSKKDELTRRYLLVMKLDIKNLFDRVVRRKNEYLEIFALKRVRTHFESVFYTRYWRADISDLVYFSEDTILTLDKFYYLIEDLRWYLDHTDDMPATIEDHLGRQFKKLKEYYDTLMLYIDVDLGIASDENQTVVDEADFDYSEPDDSEPIDFTHDSEFDDHDQDNFEDHENMSKLSDSTLETDSDSDK